MDEQRVPIIVGVGQYTNRSEDLADAREPLDMLALVAGRAEEDAQTNGLLEKLDSIRVVNILSWRYADPPAMLAERLGAHPRDTMYTPIGGNTPQWLVNQTADAIADGRVGLALLAGAEAMATRRRARLLRATLDWTPQADAAPTFSGGRIGVTEIEAAHGARLPTEIFPLFENALRAHKGRTIPEHQDRLGELCARLSQVAGDNPYAWFPQPHSKEEILAVGPDNRMIGFPYPKLMNAIMTVDQAAALIMTSVARARQLGIPEQRWVYLWAAADANDASYFSERIDYHSSPALRLIGEKALAMAGLTIDDIDEFDLYSCFPSAVQIARDMLGIPEDDPRPLTVTGGLPYAGGPGNNYTTHAIATVVERLRRQPEKKALVSALGMYVTKHALGIYSGTPSGREWSREDPQSYQRELDAAERPELTAQVEGPATVEAYTVMYGRENRPERAIVIGRLDDGRRFLANAPPDRDLLKAMVQEEAVGRRGRVWRQPAAAVNLFAF